MKIKLLRIITLLALLLVFFHRAEAGGKLYGRYPNQVNSPVFDLQLRKFKTTVDIQDQFAVVHVDEVFYNANAATLEGIYFFEMPEGSKLTEMFLWINGQRVEQVIKPRAEAVQQYEQIVRRLTDPLLAEQVGENVFRLRLFPLPPRSERRLEIKYIQPLPLKNNAIEFSFPLRLENYAGKRVDSASMHIDFKSQAPIDSLWLGTQVPLSTIRVSEFSATRYTIDFKATQTAFEYDFSFYFRLKTVPLFNTLRYAPTNPSDEGFYLNWISPPNKFFVQNAGPRQFIFCADISASMIGTRLSQLKQALGAFIDQMQSNDRFNVVTFNADISSFASGLVQADPANKARAKTYVQTLSASGLTNLNGALLTALTMLNNTTGQSQILLISDGQQPTWGETRTDSILANVKRANKMSAAIFTVGIGDEVNKDFLQLVAQQSRATAFFIGESENVTDRSVQIYGVITAPILTNVQIIPQTLVIYDIFPAIVTNLSRGMQSLQVGRYLPPGAGKFQFRAHNGKTAIDTAVAVDLRNAPDNKYVSRFWAAQKIQALLKDIERFGQRPELINAVVYLSINYSILSPYTAFLVIEPGSGTTAVDDETDSNLPRAFSLLQNYPNPFSPAGIVGQNFTTIRYTIPTSIPSAGLSVELKIYNLLGQVVRVLAIKQQSPGEYSLQWNGADEAGRLVPAGVYLVRLVAGDPSSRSGRRFVAERKVVVLR